MSFHFGLGCAPQADCACGLRAELARAPALPFAAPKIIGRRVGDDDFCRRGVEARAGGVKYCFVCLHLLELWVEISSTALFHPWVEGMISFLGVVLPLGVAGRASAWVTFYGARRAVV